MSAKLGDTVIIVGVHSRGGATHPGIITNIFAPKESDVSVDARVNLTVFPDGLPPTLRAGVPYYDSLQKANVRGAVMPFCYPQ